MLLSFLCSAEHTCFHPWYFAPCVHFNVVYVLTWVEGGTYKYCLLCCEVDQICKVFLGHLRSYPQHREIDIQSFPLAVREWEVQTIGYQIGYKDVLYNTGNKASIS